MKAPVKRKPAEVPLARLLLGRVGRPVKPPQGKRAQITLLVRADIKRTMSKRAHEAGHTLSREGELWLERLLTYDNVFGGGPDPEGRALHHALVRRGYQPLNTPHGPVWYPPGHPFEREISTLLNKEPKT